MATPSRPQTQVGKENIEKLKAKLRELFQLDRGDLDFGLYRVMAHKSAEVNHFLEKDLLPQVSDALGDIATSDISVFQKKLKTMENNIKEAELDPQNSKPAQELKNQIKSAKNDQQMEADVYNHLYNFFSRYYDEGDFMPLRRYKSGGRDAYSIPYNGEEVKLHWANADQYYIKTTENYSSYVFKPSGSGKECRVRFEIAVADNEKDVIQETNNNKRFFALATNFLTEKKNLLTIRFDHRPLTEKEKKQYPQNGNGKQAAINKEAERRICKKVSNEWKSLIAAPCPTEADESRTLLGKHLAAYTAKNSFDYFIHKDLGGFLRRELDHYLKSEVIFIDNLDLTDNPIVFRRNLAQLKAIKYVGHKIIDFVAQLEGFQKRLWLKKKFVLETNYCLTLDKAPESLYAEIAKNKAQHKEWVSLFAIDQLQGDLVGQTQYSKPLKPEFLKEHPYLVLDTRHFNKKFKDKLLAELSKAAPIEEQMNGLLIHGENFQALNLLQKRYQGKIKCVYIDPPYNTNASPILYKNNYKKSSWLSLMHGRLSMSADLMMDSGLICVAIDDEEMPELKRVLGSVFMKQVGVVVVRSNPAGRKTSERLAPAHEYALFYGKTERSTPGSLEASAKRLARYPKEDSQGHFAWANFIRSGIGDKKEDSPTLHYPIFVSAKDSIRIPDISWNAENKAYDLLERPRSDETIVWPITEEDGARTEKRWHRGHERVKKEWREEFRVRRKDGKISIDFKTHLDETSLPITWWDDNRYASANHGAIEMKALFGEKFFDFPKARKLVEDCIEVAISNSDKDTVLDYFAGSGTTGHAVINLNRENGGGDRKYILTEIGHHFDNTLLPRIKKAVYSKEWKGGRPEKREGISQLFKCIRLESYEDTLDSLTLSSKPDLLSAAESEAMAEDYQLRYALGVETEKSASLMGEDFINPFDYTLSVVRDGIRRNVQVDLAETFNFLIGLQMSSYEQLDNVLTIQGTDAKGKRCLILWRNLKKTNAARLDKWFARHRKTFSGALDLVYVNGDHTLNAMRKPADKWKALTIEPVFKELMFEEKGQTS